MLATLDMGGDRGESGGEISPICAERKNVWSKMSVNASAVFQTCQFVQYFSVLMFFHRRNFLKEFVLKVFEDETYVSCLQAHAEV